MTPSPAVSGVSELAERWRISRQAAWLVVKEDGFPEPTKLTVGPVWSDEDITQWEQEQEASGRGKPGSRRTGRPPGR